MYFKNHFRTQFNNMVQVNARGEALFNRKPFSLTVPVQANFKDKKKRLLVIVGHVSTLDLKAKALLGDNISLNTYQNVLNYAFEWATKYKSKLDAKKWSLHFYNFNFFKWYDLKEDQKKLAEAKALDRLKAHIKKVKPTHILCLSDLVAELLLEDPDAGRKRGYLRSYNKIKFVNTIDIERSFSGASENDDANIEHANLLGYVCRTASTIFTEEEYHRINVKPKSKLITTIKDVKSLIKKMNKAKCIAVDTEGTSLETLENSLATIQFALDQDVGYVIPYYHPNSPWSIKDFKLLKKLLRKFFGQKIDSYNGAKTRFLIGQNFGYDIRVLMKEFNIRYWYWNTWDLMAGEYLLDENIKSLVAYGQGQYGLEQICLNYGCDFYTKASFGKAQRATIAYTDLTKDVLNYTTMDVQVMIAIQKEQAKKAKMIVDKNGKSYLPTYHKLMLTQLNSMVRIMSLMKYRGIKIDIEYLMGLLDPNQSEILANIEKLTEEFYSLKAVKKASKIINSSTGVPTNGLFGSTFQAFSMSKKEHIKILFIDILKLEPLSYGKSGEPSFGKEFYKAYKDKERAVAIMAELAKLLKLKNAFIDSYIKQVEQSHDGRADQRVRADFGYNQVVTGRSNSRNPNFQQIPEHSTEAKIIKRMFVTPPGTLHYEADYSAHEVRCSDVENYIVTDQGNIKLKDLHTLDPKPRALSYNHENDLYEYKEILGSSIHTTKEDMLEIEYEGGVIRVTENHLVFCINQGKYIKAKDLTENDEILLGGESQVMIKAKVKSIKNLGHVQTVGDIEVKDNHNFFAVRSGTPVLIHNCWGISADEDHIRQSFNNIHKLILKYRRNPTKKNLEIKNTEGDPHKQNYHSFTGVALKAITKEMRQDAKSIIFGALYGKGLPALARDTGKTIEEIEKIYKDFFKRFEKGGAWLKSQVATTKEYMYSVGPHGRRRNLYGVLSGNSGMVAACTRQAQNSPIQGFASDIGFMAADLYSRTMHELFEKLEVKHKSLAYGKTTSKISYLPTAPNAMVHDSIKCEMPFEYFFLGMHILEWAMTKGVTKYLYDVHGIVTGVPFDIEFDIGSSWYDKDTWDFSDKNLKERTLNAIINHKEIYKDDPKIQKIKPKKLLKKMINAYVEQCKALDLHRLYPLNIY